MTEFARLLDRRLASGARLIEVAKAEQVPREVIEQGDPRVLGTERHVERAVRGIESGERLVQVPAGGQEITEIEAGNPAEPVAQIRDRHVCAVLAPLQQFGGKRS